MRGQDGCAWLAVGLVTAAHFLMVRQVGCAWLAVGCAFMPAIAAMSCRLSVSLY